MKTSTVACFVLALVACSDDPFLPPSPVVVRPVTPTPVVEPIKDAGKAEVPEASVIVDAGVEASFDAAEEPAPIKDASAATACYPYGVISACNCWGMYTIEGVRACNFSDLTVCSNVCHTPSVSDCICNASIGFCYLNSYVKKYCSPSAAPDASN